MRLQNRHLAGLALIFGLAIWGSIALTGCYNPWTITDPEIHGIEVSDTYYVQGQNEALLRFQLDVESYFGVYLGDLHRETVIYWVDTTCGPEGNYGIPWDGRCMAGLMFNCYDMYVAVSGLDEGHVCKTSLNHEFAHCLSGDIFGDYDGEHLGEIWDLVPAANARDCEGRL